MIECEICGSYFSPDEIESCPNPGCAHDDLCPCCYERHVVRCLNE